MRLTIEWSYEELKDAVMSLDEVIRCLTGIHTELSSGDTARLRRALEILPHVRSALQLEKRLVPELETDEQKANR